MRALQADRFEQLRQLSDEEKDVIVKTLASGCIDLDYDPFSEVAFFEDEIESMISNRLTEQKVGNLGTKVDADIPLAVSLDDTEAAILGEFSRGKESIRAEGGIVMVGNLGAA